MRELRLIRAGFLLLVLTTSFGGIWLVTWDTLMTYVFLMAVVLTGLAITHGIIKGLQIAAERPAPPCACASQGAHSTTRYGRDMPRMTIDPLHPAVRRDQ